ncbi:CD9 antigen-like [Oopsacas minuta]|uniref:CD9 antigen-like n=1 Tax=Oopsacas minuta TaxID=111878 RepID=A0AAV7K9T1_9METZ|nr:CD9 antigen-like [Oopsacas minuta]
MSSTENIMGQSGPYDNKGISPPDENTASVSVEVTKAELLEIEEPGTEDRSDQERLNNLRAISCLRVSIIIYNLLFLLMSLIIISVGIYMYVSGDDVSFSVSTFVSGSIVVVIIGITILALSIMGLVVALLPLYILLFIYCVLMFLVFAVEVSIGVWGFVNYDDITISIRQEFLFGITVEYGNDNVLYVSTIDSIQDVFDCCGYYGYLDWDTSTYQNNTFFDESFVYYPMTCCDNNFIIFNGVQYCNSSQLMALSVPGCINKVNTFAKGLVIGIGVIGVILALLQMLGILMTLFLCCYKSKFRDMKLTVMPSFKDQ